MIQQRFASTNIPLLVLHACLLLLAGKFFVYGFIEFQEKKAFDQEAIKVEGTVVNAVEVVESCTLTYKFSVKKYRYERTIEILPPCLKKVGDEIIVYYLPNHPQHISISENHIWNYGLDFFNGVMCLGVVGFLAFLCRQPDF